MRVEGIVAGLLIVQGLRRAARMVPGRPDGSLNLMWLQAEGVRHFKPGNRA